MDAVESRNEFFGRVAARVEFDFRSNLACALQPFLDRLFFHEQARAISELPKPHRALSVRASWFSRASRGWQQANIILSWLSSISESRNSSSSPSSVWCLRGGQLLDDAAANLGCGAGRRGSCSWRLRCSQPDGILGGTPTRHACRASSSVDCTMSSTRSKCRHPKTRVSTETSRPASWRKKCSTSGATVSGCVEAGAEVCAADVSGFVTKTSSGVEPGLISFSARTSRRWSSQVCRLYRGPTLILCGRRRGM